MATKLAGQTCPSCLAHGVTSYLGSNGVCGRCWRKAEGVTTVTQVEAAK